MLSSIFNSSMKLNNTQPDWNNPSKW